MDYKLIYLARRNPAIAQDDFPEAWRDHSRLATKFAATLGSHFRSVRQCVKIWDADMPESFRNDHDGAALLAMKSREDMEAARFHPRSLDEMKKDEERTFAGYVANWTMPAQEERIVDSGDGEVALLSFLARKRDVDEADFATRLRAASEGLAERAGERLMRLTVNRVIEPRDPPYDFAAILELWFGSPGEAEAAARDPAFIEALEQPGTADPARGVRMMARINYDKATKIGADGATGWDLRRES